MPYRTPRAPSSAHERVAAFADLEDLPRIIALKHTQAYRACWRRLQTRYGRDRLLRAREHMRADEREERLPWALSCAVTDLHRLRDICSAHVDVPPDPDVQDDFGGRGGDPYAFARVARLASLPEVERIYREGIESLEAAMKAHWSADGSEQPPKEEASPLRPSQSKPHGLVIVDLTMPDAEVRAALAVLREERGIVQDKRPARQRDLGATLADFECLRAARAGKTEWEIAQSVLRWPTRERGDGERTARAAIDRARRLTEIADSEVRGMIRFFRRRPDPLFIGEGTDQFVVQPVRPRTFLATREPIRTTRDDV